MVLTHTWAIDNDPAVVGNIDSVAAEAISMSASLNEAGGHKYEKRVSWVIVGAESGHNARPCSLDWIRLIIHQCKSVNIAVYVKQFGTFWVKESDS